MSRIPYVTDDDCSDEVKQLFDAALYTTGRVSNLQRLLAHVPWLYRWHFGMSVAAQKNVGGLDSSTKALVHIRAAHLHRCAYCTDHNLSFGHAAGLSDEQLNALQADDPAASGVFDDAQLAVIAWAEAVATNTAKRDRDSFERVSEHFTVPEVVEIAFLAASRTMSSLIAEALWVDLEQEGEIGRMRAELSQQDGLVHYCTTMLEQLEAERADRAVTSGA